MTTAANGRFIFSDLCRELRTPPSRVRYYLGQLGVQPVDKVAHINVYSSDTLDAIRAAIVNADDAKGAGK
jgi:hypothetical protein